MKILVSPSEVVALAFGSPNTLGESAIPPHSILASQQSFLLPALGEELYDSLTAEEEDGSRGAFVEEYLKQPLALYVAARLLPTLAVRVGEVGVVRLAGESFEVVNEATLRKVVARLRAEADTLLARATTFLANNLDLFPDYNPLSLTRRIIGGVVM